MCCMASANSMYAGLAYAGLSDLLSTSRTTQGSCLALHSQPKIFRHANSLWHMHLIMVLSYALSPQGAGQDQSWIHPAS